MIFWGKGVLLRPPGSTLKLSLVLICCRCICDIATGTAWDTFQTNENLRHQQLAPPQSSTNGIPAKLNLSQLRRHAGGKDWDDLECCWLLLLSYQKSIPGSNGCHVSGASVALRTKLYSDTNDGRIHYFQTFSVIFQNRVQQKVIYTEPTVLFLSKLKCNSGIFSDLPGNRQP